MALNDVMQFAFTRDVDTLLPPLMDWNDMKVIKGSSLN